MPRKRLNAEEVAALVAQHYGLSAAGIEAAPIVGGPSSEAWRVAVRADRRVYCLKSHRERGIDELKAEHALLSCLHEAGFPLSPAAVRHTTGDTAFLHHERAFALYRFIESDAPFVWTRGGWSIQQAHSAGIALAEFHSLASTCRDIVRTPAVTAEGLRSWGLAVLQRASGLFPSDVMIRVSKFEEVLRGSFAVASDVRTHGVIHGDFHPGNVLYKGEQVVGVLDYEYCRVDSRLFDVAYATMTFSFENIDPAYSLAFLDGYNLRAKFGKMDIAELQPLVRLSAWLSAIWLIEQCQKDAAGHDEVLPALRKCIAILSATFD